MNCPSLDYVYDMTWAEFRIRLHAYRRQELDKVKMLRELAWVTYIAPHQNPKKMKKTIDQFWPLKKSKTIVSDQMREMIKGAQEQYYEELNKKQNE